MNEVITQDQMPRLPTMQAGGAIRAIVPQDFEGAWRIASAVVKAGMAPTGLGTTEKVMVAIMHGLEVGMTPMAALQSIAVINGRPTIWGDGAIGLVRGSGKCEWIKERVDGSGDAMVAHCEVKRKGEPDPIKATFSVADAKKASLWDKAGPWKQYPKRMLAMRARAFALRDGFADVLRGLGIAEEVSDYAQLPRDVTPVATPAARIAPPPPPPPVEEEQSEDPGAENPEELFDRARAWFANCANIEDVETAWSDFEHEIERLGPEDAEHLKSIYREAQERFEPNVLRAG